MSPLVKHLIAATLILSLSACATVSCPPGMHPGPYGRHCHPDRGPPLPPPPPGQ
jgi:hypothetical protein